MENGSQDRNLPASERKLKKARDDGQVNRSEDLSHLAVLGAGAGAIMLLSPYLFEQLRQSISRQLSFDASTLRFTGPMMERLGDATQVGIIGCAVFSLIVVLAVVISSVTAGGWVTSLKPLMPDLSRLDPLEGFARLFSKRKLISLAKMLLLASILASITVSFLSSNLQTLAGIMRQPSSAALLQLSDWTIGGMGLLILVLLVAAMIDVPLQNFLHKGELKMSRQEIKEEGKESDGNPQVRSKIRQKQRELAKKSSVTAVPKADFVVMNPTHFAVAIRYDEKNMRAPQVISKGADLLAMKIRDIARQNNIPVLQAPMLARALYANTEIDQEIPSALYTAVAQVLAYVYRLRSALRGDGPMPPDMPQPFVPPELDPQSKTLKAVEV